MVDTHDQYRRSTHLDAWTTFVIIITGDNFISVTEVCIDDMIQMDVEFIDEHTIRVNLSNDLAPGIFEVWVINPAGQAGIIPKGIWVG